MRELLTSWVRTLTAAGLFTGAVQTLAPGGRPGKVLRLVCALLLLAALLSPLGKLDYAAYAEELTRQRLLGRELSTRGETEAAELLGNIIREETEAYILDQAAELELPVLGARVTLAEGEDVPLPWQAELWLEGPIPDTAALAEVLEGELGIPRSRQVWYAVTEHEG